MITKQQAIEARYAQVFHHRRKRNSDGSPVRVRVSGRCKTWKTRPDEFSLPVKYGLYESGYITQSNAAEWCESEAEALGQPE